MKRAIRCQSDREQPGPRAEYGGVYFIQPLTSSITSLESTGGYRKEKFAFSPTRPSIDEDIKVRFYFGMTSISPSAEAIIEAYTEIQDMSSYTGSGIFAYFGTSFSGNLPIIKPVAKLDQEKLEEIRKDRFRTLEEIDPFLQEKAKEVVDAWKNQPPISLSQALDQIHRNLKR